MADTIRESLELSAPRPQTPYYNEITTGIQQSWTPPSERRSAEHAAGPPPTSSSRSSEGRGCCE